ncbi:hypothetical protein IF2G_06435 [Cordyceps javanica]|nr:hypothetical protein IF2G_06435 [Cordyceps javanica]
MAPSIYLYVLIIAQTMPGGFKRKPSRTLFLFASACKTQSCSMPWKHVYPHSKQMPPGAQIIRFKPNVKGSTAALQPA